MGSASYEMKWTVQEVAKVLWLFVHEPLRLQRVDFQMVMLHHCVLLLNTVMT